MVLVGSYARGDATPYSDVDVIRFVREEPDRAQQKLYTYRDGRLLGIVTQTLAHYREGFTVPERAIFEVPSLREAQILVEKDEAFRVLQQEARAFVWEPLQAAANDYASTVMMEYTEYVQKILRALLLGDELALSEMILDLLAAVTFAVDVQRGILATSGNSYFRQVYESVGLDAAWTRYHRFIVGIDSSTMGRATTQARGVAALRFYRETVQLLRPAFHALHRDVIEQTVLVIERALSDA
jgi:predicted nucleotidyltransferase